MVSESVTLPYEKEAMRGDELPAGMEYPDQVMYLNLRLLYKSYHMGIVTREQAKLEKKKLLDEYRVYKYNRELEKEIVDMIRKTELARAAYRKDRTLENADLLLNAVEGR